MTDNKQLPKVLRSQWLSHSRLFHVEEQHLQFANGETRIYERLNPGKHNAVMIIAMLDSDTVLLAREYGAGLGRYYLSLPKGAMDAGETAVETANRELMEEAGYGANKLEVMKQFALSPSYMGNQITLVLAQDLYEKRLPGDEPEEIEIIPYKMADIDTLIASDEFTEPYAVAALLMIRERQRNGQL